MDRAYSFSDVVFGTEPIEAFERNISVILLTVSIIIITIAILSTCLLTSGCVCNVYTVVHENTSVCIQL